YVLQVKGRKEEQKSSGVWVSTAAGSTAAAHSAGGRLLPKHSKEIQFVVREPFVKKRKRLRLIRGKLKPSQSIRFRSAMSRAAVFLDGAHIHYEVKYGDEVEIRSAKQHIKAVLNYN